METIRRIFGNATDLDMTNVSDAVIYAMVVIIGLLVLVSIYAFIVEIVLGVKYVKYNKRKNSCGQTGEQIARGILDRNGLFGIKVTKSGSFLFGNSYSHYFKKVRLRRRTWQKDSLTSLAMAAQKSSLAILDKEGDSDMKKRVRLTPIIYVGPLAFVPLIIIGALLDIFVFKSTAGTALIICAIIGLVIYLASFAMSVYELKTEKKAQVRALKIMGEEGLATGEEIDMCRELFKLYNIEYVNNMIIALLELIYRILQIIMYAQGSKSTSSN